MTVSEQQRDELVKQLTGTLSGRRAHLTFEEATEGIPFEYVEKKPANVPYSIWQLAEHIRIAQKDILEFSRDGNYRSPKWPEGYWPAGAAPKNPEQWKNTLKEIEKDREAFIDLLKDTANDIYEPFPHGDGQNLLREALLIIDHNAYHTGQILIVRRLLGIYG